MPIYQVAHCGLPLTVTQRDRLARGITRIHHDVTNAPEPFVRIVFQPVPFGLMYTAGELAPSIIVHGSIRDGRSEVARQQIVQRCYDLVVDVTSAAPNQVVVSIDEVPYSWIMEAGYFMPPANDTAEGAWIAQLQAAYPGDFDDWGSGGKAPEMDGDRDDQSRLQRLRRLTDRYVTLARGQGQDVRSLFGQLIDQLGPEPATEPAGSGRR
ncbi:tautomerase family protein [Nakamurella leprariae]|uniref:Tautomerase cis-CaaD-like domain-containing protein n=1 Tax=Nakamurella leprariae TaxID=2803911 RepID=A0A938YBQ9_9ACTN|nr:tautomerase family protein [Nakamurella leprariae]MBM9466671.1 hypothetical protein [Nakamurella leprariae]